MADLAGNKDSTYYNETKNNFSRISSMSRPSGKAIYRQRKEYGKAVLEQQHDLQHRVEHLLTCHVDGKEISNVDDCIDRLKMVDAQGQVWGQGMILQVKNYKLLLTDIESQEELDSYPLEHIRGCTSVLDCGIYNSILAITVKEMNPPRTDVMLFQCEEIGAELMKTKLDNAIEEWKGERQNHDLLRNNLENMLYRQSQASFLDRGPQISPDKRAESMDMDRFASPLQQPWQRQEQQPWRDNRTEAEQPFEQRRYIEANQEGPESLMMWDVERDTEILNHILSDIEIFVGKLPVAASGSQSVQKQKMLKKKKNKKKLPPEPEFRDCFQKIKYCFNLLGKLEHVLQEPSAPELLHLVFSTLSTILYNCPSPNLASSVVSPLLIPAAVDLLRHTLNSNEQTIWRSLGDAWNLSRAQYPEGQSIPVYIPIFSDGWVPPMSTQSQIQNDLTPNGIPNSISDRNAKPPLLMKAVYDFRARNFKELTVMKGDILEVLDQQRKWWLARNAAGEKGYIPNNILEPIEQKTPNGSSMQQASGGFPELQPTSSAAEVTVWLRTNGFSKITVKTLGILTGNQLLSLSQEELKAVCPEEGRRVFSKLSAVKATLGLSTATNSHY